MKIMASSPITLCRIQGKKVKAVTYFIFLVSKITADGDWSQKLKDASSLEGKYDQPRQYIKKQRYYFVNKGPSSQG